MDKSDMGSLKILGKIKCLRVERQTRKILYFVEGVSVTERQMA